MALVLTPEPPVDGWLGSLSEQIARSPGFFDSRPVVLDLGLLPPEQANVAGFIQKLADSGIRVIGTENAHPAWPGVARWGGPVGPVGNGNATVASPRDGVHSRTPRHGAAREAPSSVTHGETLLVERTVRSGQQILNEGGDVTVVGGVAWGAEVIAAGSIHVYGTLRGRAIAGFSGNKRARIFCRRLEAELLAIDGLYRTAEGWDPALNGQPAQIWLDGEALLVARME